MCLDLHSDGALITLNFLEFDTLMWSNPIECLAKLNSWISRWKKSGYLETDHVHQTHDQQKIIQLIRIVSLKGVQI